MPVIAQDLGGTKLATALISDEGRILITKTHPVEKRKGREVSDLVVGQANQMLKEAEQKKFHVTSIGICVPGISYSKTKKVWAPNIAEWDNFPLFDELQNGLHNKNLKIKIDNDRACYISGEVWQGNAKGCSDAIFLSVGTGIGAGIMVDNTILRGSNDIAGAIGWVALEKPFDKKFIPCGCFEYSASGEGIARVAKEWLKDELSEVSILAEKTLDSLTAKDVFEAYEKHDKLAIKIINHVIGYWGMAVANLVSLFNPEKIIFGGGVFGPALMFLDAIYEEAKKWAQPISIQQLKLEGSALGSQAGLYGAAYQALQE